MLLYYTGIHPKYVLFMTLSYYNINGCLSVSKMILGTTIFMLANDN